MGLFELFEVVGDGGEVVAETILPRVVYERTEGVSFAFAACGFHEVGVEYFGLPVLEGGAVVAQEVLGDNLLVVEAGGILIIEGAYTAVEELPHGVEVSAGTTVFLFFHGSKHFSTALVFGVVVEVAHDDHLIGGVGCHDAVGNVLRNFCGCHARWCALASSVARWPVVDDDVYGLIGHGSADEQLVAAHVFGIRGEMVFVGCHLVDGEESWVVDEGHVDAASVGGVVVYVFESHGFERLGVAEVADYALVFYFAYSYGSHSAGACFACEFRDDEGHVVEFLLIVGFYPVVGSAGQVFVVTGIVWVVFGVEEVFEVIEGHGIYSQSLG